MATYQSRGGVKWNNVYRAVTPPTHALVDKVYDQARTNLIPHNRTGRLLGSLRRVKRLAAGSVIIGTNHWRFIEYGVRAHRIVARVKRALWWPGATHPVRAVNHPGNNEYAPMRRALRRQAGS